MSDANAFRAFERDVHDRIATGYHDAFSPVTAAAHEPLLRAAGVASGSTVLDVATGPGVLAGKAARLGADVTAIDLSANMAALAQRLEPEVEVHVGSAEALPFADASFDAVLSSFGIGHFPEPGRAFAEFYRVLRADGRLAVSWWEGPERSRINGLFFDVLQEEQVALPQTLPPGPSAFHFSDDGHLAEAFEAAGFPAPDIESHSGVHELADFDALWSLARNSFARLGTIIAGLPDDERELYRRAVAAKAAAYGTGPLRVPIAFKVASASRGSRRA
jgi:ubiquinone/menaquinone biosynthesis C-methylase UbiE